MTSDLDITILSANFIVEDGVLTKFRYRNGKLDRETNQQKLIKRWHYGWELINILENRPSIHPQYSYGIKIIILYIEIYIQMLDYRIFKSIFKCQQPFIIPDITNRLTSKS